MIRIDKGQAPDVIGEKCKELIDTMKRVHDVLVEAYQEQTNAGQLIQRTDDIDERLVEAYLGDQKKTKGGKPKKWSKKARKGAESKLNSLHYGEIVESELPRASTVFTKKAVESTRKAFVGVFSPLHADYIQLLDLTMREWVEQFPWKDIGEEKHEQWAMRVWRWSARFYQKRRIAGLITSTADRQQIEDWVKTVYSDVDQSLWRTIADYTGYFTNVLARQYQLAGQHKTESALLQELTGYAGSRKVTVDDVFDFFRDRTVELAERESLYFGLAPNDIAELTEDEDHWTRVGNLVLGSQAFVAALETIKVPEVVVVKRPLIGWASDHFDSTYYSGNGIKESLLDSHHGKCAYCEAPVDHIAHGDVEHFRPKAGYDYGHGFNSGGYFWQAYAWENLFYACQICNQVFKGNQFPVLLDDQYRPTRYGLDLDISVERPVLIDMGREDPREHIRFNPIDGSAYPYDLVRAFYEKYPPNDTLGATSIADLLHRSPRHIPLYRNDRRYRADTKNHKVVIESAPPPHELYTSIAPPNFWDFAAQAEPTQLRGLLNIMILGLNRDKLVRDRVRHLRQLRGMFWAHFQGSEKDAALAALQAAVAAQSPYSSLSIDAIATWEREIERLKQVALNTTNSVQVELRTEPWLGCYRAILARPVAPPPDTELPIKSAPVLYFVDVTKVGSMAKQREVVYLTANYELPNSLPGWYLQIPDEDLHLVAKVVKTRKRKGKKYTDEAKIKLGKLIEKGAAYFKEATITVKGPFSANLS
jgi:hypothetical protein